MIPLLKISFLDPFGLHPPAASVGSKREAHCCNPEREGWRDVKADPVPELYLAALKSQST